MANEFLSGGGFLANAPQAETVTVRLDSRNEIDEVFLRGVNVHFEALSDSEFYIGVDGPDGRYWQFWIGNPSGRAKVQMKQTDEPS